MHTERFVRAGQGFSQFAYAAPRSAYSASMAMGLVEPVAADQATLPGREVPLYTAGHVALATFFGTPLGGGFVLALNEHRLGRSVAALLTLLFTGMATALVVILALALPEGTPLPFGLLGLFIMSAVARKRQGVLVAQHTAQGGRQASGWAAFGFGLLSLALVFIPVFVIAFLYALVTMEAGG